MGRTGSTRRRREGLPELPPLYPINPLQVARSRETERSSGGKSDAADAHTMADMVRTRRHTLRPMAGDSGRAETVKVLTRAHKTLIWDKTRHTLRLRQTPQPARSSASPARRRPDRPATCTTT